MSARRDTPIDLPTVNAGGPLLRATTLETEYAQWETLRSEFRQLSSQWRTQAAQLDAQGTLLLGAVRHAQGSSIAVTSPAADQLAVSPLAEAEATLRQAKDALDRARRAATQTFEQQSQALRALIISHVQQLAATAKPLARLMVRTLPSNQRILHLESPRGDEAVLLQFALSGHLPSRYGFLHDDSTEEATLPPAWLYDDEGESIDVRPNPSKLGQYLPSAEAVWPVKGMIALEAHTRWWRWLSRGPVLEAELGEATGFRNVLVTEEAELLIAHLLRLKGEGRLQLELSLG